MHPSMMIPSDQHLEHRSKLITASSLLASVGHEYGTPLSAVHIFEAELGAAPNSVTLSALWDVPGADLQSALRTSSRSQGLTPIERGSIARLIKYAAEQSKFVPPDLGASAISQQEAAQSGTKRKLSMIIDPTLDQEMIAPSLAETQGYLKCYDSINGGLPLVSEEPTGEQIKGVKMQTDQGNPPYTGFQFSAQTAKRFKHA